MGSGGVKKYIAVGSETAGSWRLWDGGMFSVHNSPSPHPTCRHINTLTHRAPNMNACKILYETKCTHYSAVREETHVLHPPDMSGCCWGGSSGVRAARS